MKTIPITKNKVVVVSDVDYIRAAEHGWSFHPCGYAKARINKEYVLMHRWLLGAKKGEEVDHINGNKLDNRRENLRLCTSSQNKANAGLRKNNTTGYKGVDWNKSHNRFRARIVVHRKMIMLGYFKKADDAARAYDVAARRFFGPFALTNF